MAVWDSDSGGALNGNTIAVHSTENAAKISSANRPLVRASNGQKLQPWDCHRVRRIPGEP